MQKRTDIIAERDQNQDGDTHMLLKLDPGQYDLLTKKNHRKKDGNLVVEVVCSAPVNVNTRLATYAPATRTMSASLKFGLREC